MANTETNTEKQILKSDVSLCGRRKIFTSADKITKDNIVNVLNEVLSMHIWNMEQEEYLYWYRRGIQPILWRTREIRPELVKQVVVNNANQIVTFCNGYFMTSPASYSSRLDDKNEQVKQFNDYCLAAQKEICDNEVVDWFHTVGLGVIYLEPNDDDRRPFNVWSLDPRSAFNVYSYAPGNPRVMGVNCVIVNGEVIFDVYTKDTYFKLKGGLSAKTTFNTPVIGTATTLIKDKPNVLKEIPIIEYQRDINRMGSFEAAVPICDAINEMQSQLQEGIEGSIQQLCVAYNCNFDDGTTANQIRESGMLVLRSTGENKADFQILESNVSQAETQTNIDSLYEQLLDKTGLPSISRGEGGSSDNGSAVYLKSGYFIADTNRRNTEDFWRKSDEEFKRVALRIIQMRFASFDLEPSDMELNIEPPTMSNLLVKTQSALNMRELGLAPQIWLERSGLSNDPIADIELSKEYIYRFYEQGMNTDNQTDKSDIAEGEALADDRQVEELSAFELD